VQEVATMAKLFTLEYRLDDNWYVGRPKEVPGVFSQGETLNDLENSIREAYALMMEDEVEPNAKGRQTKQIEVAV
jgi:predicted RNase H-like HicB family nuclease